MDFNTKEYLESLLSCKSNDERYDWIQEVLFKLNIPFVVQAEINKNAGLITRNIICFGSSDLWYSAHYDVIYVDKCANDNSASIINMIHIKLLRPDHNIVFLDKEEPPYYGFGSTSFSKFAKKNQLNIKSILNLELTGFGNTICLGDRDSVFKATLVKDISGSDYFSTHHLYTPFNDAYIFLQNGIDSILVMLLPKVMEKVNEDVMYWCHTSRDKLENIQYEDMNKFVQLMATIN